MPPITNFVGKILMECFEFFGWLTQRMKYPLPGTYAQQRMASPTRVLEWKKSGIPDHSRPGAVLILFYPGEKTVSLVLIQRPEYQGVHGGQISFPGGKWEKSDESLICTALRESNEEIGINPDDVHVIGKLSPLYIPPSNYLVTPIVGYACAPLSFHPDNKEVDSIIEIAFEDLISRDIIQRRTISTSVGLFADTPAYVIGPHVIWGATAMIISELLEITGEYCNLTTGNGLFPDKTK